jgi:hypothetical protein
LLCAIYYLLSAMFCEMRFHMPSGEDPAHIALRLAMAHENY